MRRGERIGIVGPNGAGKSTLLKLLAGTRRPELDAASVRRGTNLQEGYFDQHLGALDPERTPRSKRSAACAAISTSTPRASTSRASASTATIRCASCPGFSGGERSRLALAKLLLEPRNLLFLDEPTNHLDIPAAEILEEALVGFEGTVILVSHDRRFLETVTTRIVSVRDGEVDVYPGGFSDFASARSAEGEPPHAGREPKKSERRRRPTSRRRSASTRRRSRSSRDRESARSASRSSRISSPPGEKQLGEMRAKLREDPRRRLGEARARWPPRSRPSRSAST